MTEIPENIPLHLYASMFYTRIMCLLIFHLACVLCYTCLFMTGDEDDEDNDIGGDEGANKNNNNNNTIQRRTHCTIRIYDMRMVLFMLVLF